MTDLELIVWASKASGFEYTKNENPLESDSLALRLAVKLGLLVDCDEVLQEVEVVLVMRGHDDDFVRMSEKYGNDPYAATRRAIVRAAAEIGGLAP